MTYTDITAKISKIVKPKNGRLREKSKKFTFVIRLVEKLDGKREEKEIDKVWRIKVSREAMQ